MPLKAILKLIGLQPIPANEPKAIRRERQTEEWELIGYSFINNPLEEKILDQVPEWLKREWNKVRGTTRTLGGKWKIRHGVEDPETGGYGTGYFRNGKTFRYMIVDWEGGQGTTGTGFYRKLKHSK